MRLHFFRHLGVPFAFLKQSEQSREPGAKSRHSSLSSGEDEIDSFGDAEPMLLFRGQLFAAGRGQFVIARFAIVIGDAPLGFDPALRFQAIKRGIKRSLFNMQDVLRHLLYPIGDGEAVPRIVLERFQDQHVERAVNEVRFFLGHTLFCYLDSLGEQLFNHLPRLSRGDFPDRIWPRPALQRALTAMKRNSRIDTDERPHPISLRECIRSYFDGLGFVVKAR